MWILGILLIPSAAAGFIDATTDWGLDSVGFQNLASAWGDFDNDGYPDLYVSGVILRNTGSRFVIADVTPSGTGIWGDADNDGDLDLYTFTSQAHLYVNNWDTTGTFDEATGAMPLVPMTVSRGASWGDFDGDGDLDIYIGGYETPGYQKDAILWNHGEGTFGIRWVYEGDGGNRPGRGVTSCDFDEDGDLDIYVSNYRLEANHLWVNDGLGNFTQGAYSHGAAGRYEAWAGYLSFGHTIGSAWGDLDNDGDFDLFVGNFSHYYINQDRATFLVNGGAERSWTFAEVNWRAGLAWQESYASPALADFDNDGDTDLFFTTVYSGDWPVLYRNEGDWTFVDTTWHAGLNNIFPTYQAAWADVNADGALDLVSGGRLYINEGNDHHWLLVRLVGNGTTTNTTAVGSQVRIFLESGDILTRQVEAGTGEFNQNDTTLHFGLGDQNLPVDLRIVWPDGTQTIEEDVTVDQMLWIEQ